MLTSSSLTARADDHDFRLRAVARVEARLRDICAGVAAFAPLVEHLLAAPGKRFRAQLTLAAAALDGDDLDALSGDAIAIAAGVELLHEASLVHDDVCDGSFLRRGKPSIAAAFGVRAAVRFGLWLAGRGLRLLGDIERRHHLGLCFAPLVALAEGQILETLPPEGSLGAHREHYLAVVRGKTATLMALACDTGARFAGIGEPGRAGLARFADSLGVAYQVLDDVRDVLAPDSLGKPGGTDATNGILTWPVLEWLRVQPEAEAAPLGIERILPPGIGRIRMVLPVLREDLQRSGALRRAREFAAAELAACRAALADLPASAGRAWLLELSRLDG